MSMTPRGGVAHILDGYLCENIFYIVIMTFTTTKLSHLENGWLC